MYYVLHEADTGAFIGVATDVAGLPASIGAVPYETKPDFALVMWDAVSRLCIPRTPSTISRQTFMDRLGDACVVGVEYAAQGSTIEAAQLRAWLLRFLIVQEIDVLDPRTIGGVDAMIAAGLLDAERRTLVLALP